MLEALAHRQQDTAQCGRDGRIERLVRASLDSGWKVHAGATWLTVAPPGATQTLAHGWKLHISSRAGTFRDLAERLLPVLIDERCPFKLARSERVLDELNDGITSPSAVGKAVTVYPDQDRVRDLGVRLAEVLAGHEGPRVLSDRRVAASAPVYYRYGPFIARPVANARGEVATWLEGPDGERFEAAATLTYQQPPWAVDPFTGQSAGPGDSEPPPLVIGSWYQIGAGIRQSARGNVYRAVDLRDSGPVIVKQARALVSEDSDRVDTRLRLRNERRVYQAVDGVPGVPRFIDHFSHGADEFLVTSDCGDRTLAEDVLRSGPYQAEPGAGTRELGRLARQLARIVGAVHERGVLIRDLAPTNIVLDGAEVSVVDFGLAAYDGLHLGGGTPGYAPARQLRDEPPSPADDLHALGMTLLFAATRLHPVVLGDDDGIALTRALELIEARYGAEPAGIMGDVARLLAGGDAAAQALARLAAPAAPPDQPAARGRPSREVKVTSEVAREVRDSLRDQLLRQVDQIVDATGEGHEAYDASVYTGSAGIGLELLAQAAEPAVAARLADLASFTARTATLVDLPHGLYTGRTGVDVFLAAARGTGVSVGADAGAPAVPAADFEPAGDDLIVGAAGIGLGQLRLARLTGNGEHLAAARRCAALLIRDGTSESSFGRDPRPEYAVDPSAGQAHGLAGITGFLVSLAEQTGDPDAARAAESRSEALAGRALVLVGLAADRAASPLAASWCQGLTGIGATLVHAGQVLDDPRLVAVADQAARACLALTSRMGALGACCGAAGVGCFLLDLAAATGDSRYLDAARAVAGHMLLRSGGTRARPVLTDQAPDSFGASWSAGLAGMLTFFRRLADDGGPGIWPACQSG